MEGLGELQGGVWGTLQHTVLLTSDKGVPLGLIGQQYWSRESAAPFAGKESLKWERGLRAVVDRLAATGKKVVVVQDREAAIFSFFKYPRDSDTELLVRVHQQRLRARCQVSRAEGNGAEHQRGWERGHAEVFPASLQSARFARQESECQQTQNPG